MKLSQGAYGMLVQRYGAVLKKCRLLNVLACAALAGATMLGCADLAQASGEALSTTGNMTFTSSDYFSSLTVNSGHTVTVEGNGTGDVDLSMSATAPVSQPFPFVSSEMGSVTVESGGALKIVNDVAGQDVGTRVNAGDVQVKGGSLASSSNFHVGIIGPNTVKHGFRIYSLTVSDGGRVDIDNKLGIMNEGVITIQNGEMHVNQLENDRSMGLLAVGESGVLHVRQQFTSDNNEAFTLDIQNGGKLVVGDNGEAATSDVKMTINVSGSSEIEGSLQGKVDLAVQDGSSLTLQGGTVDVESLSGSGAVAVGTSGNAGALAGGNVSMAGGQIAFDPEFAAAGDASNASLGGLQFTSDSIDAKVVVGRNSMVSLGSKDAEWLRGEVNQYQSEGKGSWGQDVTAALALRTPQTLASTGALKVDGAWSHGGEAPAAGTANFAAKSLLVVDAAGVGSGTALAGSGGSLDVDGQARLLIAGGKEGQTVKITDGFSSADNHETGWTGASLATNTALLEAEAGEFDKATGAYSVTLKKGESFDPEKRDNAFPYMSDEMRGLAGAMAANPGVDENSPNAGVRFVSRALSDSRIGRSNARLASSTLEGAAQMSAVGAVQATTMGAANAGASAVAARSSMALPNRGGSRLQAVHLDSEGKVQPSGLSAGDETASFRNGLGVWLMPLYQADNVWGMKSGAFKGGWNSSLGGLALGADWTFDSMFRIGAAFNLGGGYAKSNGDFASTDNRFNFWGVGIYGAWSHDGFGLTADAGYTANSSSLDQDLPAAMGMPRLEADVTSHAWHAGLKAEYRFSFGDLDVIPHLGVRYMNVMTDKYDVESGGGTVFEVDRATQDIWTFPLGVEFAYGFESGSGWKFTPRLDLGVVPAAGDVKAKSRTRIPGVNGQADMKMQVVDYVTFDGGLGFDLSKDSFSLGVSYNLQASEHRTGHGVSATLRWEF